MPVLDGIEAVRRILLDDHKDRPERQRVGLGGRATERTRTGRLRLMTVGVDNREIARELFLGVQTVKSHVAAVLSKLGGREPTTR